MNHNNYCSDVKLTDFHPETQKFYKGKNVLVTGGSGFIGSHVVEQLLELKSKVVVLTRQSDPKFIRHLRDLVEVRVADLTDETQTLKAFEGSSIALNLAACVAGIEYNKNHPATIFRTNMQSFLNAIEAAKKLNFERFVTVSSACVYPRFCTIPTPEVEGFQGEPEPTNSGYGWAKRMEEYLSAKYAEEFNLSVAIPRPYNAYGPRDNFDPKSSHVIPALIWRALNAPDGVLNVWGTGQESRSFLYVDDFARGVIEIGARYAKAQPLNLGTSEEVTISQAAGCIAEVLASLTSKKIKLKFDPNAITGQPRRACDTSLLVKELGFEAKVQFRLGVEKTINWFLKEGLR